ncbi:class F sortase [Nocardioides sp. LML1-1-1.1]|uniref:class F sortase n=1 Tax=Nocardioides sp. LML1-1-1.1 TaxID=3135248 RepID=UPI00343C0E68
MTPLRLLVRGVLAALVLLTLVGLPLAPARAERIGPGHPSSTGFSGYTTRAGHELGTARIPGGPPGICLDTGTRRWPSRAARPRLATDPVIGYLLSTRLDAARHDAVLAAALWWTVGHALGLNSQPDAMASRLAEVRRESPAVHARIVRASRALLVDAGRHAPPATGYSPGRPTLATEGPSGTLSGLGLRSARGAWVPGVLVRVTLSGATFADGSTSRHLRSGDKAVPALSWRRSGGGAVAVRVRYEQVPEHRYQRYVLGARYQRVAASAGHRTLTTSATTPALRTPRLTTRVNRQRALVGDTLEDAVTVSGTGGTPLRGEWLLLGPVTPDRRQQCGALRWSGAAVAGRGTFGVVGDGTVRVGRTRLERAGCYTYRERLLPSARTSGTAWTAPGIPEETALATLTTPTLRTRVNRQRALPGDTLVDAVTVTGTQAVPLTGEWQLLGPVAPVHGQCGGASWTGAPVLAQGTFAVSGDGTVQVGGTRVPRAGCFTYRERLRPSSRSTGAPWTAAGLAEETTLVTLVTPRLATRVDRQRSLVGDTLTDAVTVTGTQGVPHTGDWLLLGPVAPDRALRCTGARWAGAPVAAHGTFAVSRDGTVRVGRTRLRRGGCYTYRERLRPSSRSTGSPWTAAGLAEETSLAGPRQPAVPGHPSVDTGGGRSTPSRGSGRTGQARVVVPTAGVGATLESVAFRGATLPAPHERRRAGLWDGSVPLSSLVGTTLLAGHVSDDHDRPGAFHGLRRARVGQRVTTVDASGAVRHWRIVRVRAIDRRHLPRSLFLQGIARRLVLVTCTDRVSLPGGGFHYRKNLVVEAVPQ